MKKKFLYYIALLCILSFLSFTAKAQEDERAFKIIPIQDSLYARVGKKEEVFSRVFGHLVDNKHNIILAMGDPFPNQILTLIIKPSDKNKFPPALYQNVDLKITGVLESNNGKLEMRLFDPKQISLVVRTISNYKE